ncbi:MAG: EAL domain-containing protein [Rhodoferax sp.]|nr:EAL domain-containing protein [Rhodoferax sp.]
MLSLDLITRRALATQWAILCAAWLLIAAGVAYSLWEDRRQISVTEGDRLRAQSQVMANTLERELAAIGRALDDVRDDMSAWQKSPEYGAMATRRLNSLSRAMPSVRTIAVMDELGNVLVANRPELVGSNFAQRDYFRAVQRNPRAQTLFVSEPFTTALGAQVITVSRMTAGAEGRFGGLVTATLDPVALSFMLESVRYADDMSAGIVHGSGKLFLYSPPAPDQFGQDLNQPGSIFSRHAQSGAQVSTLIGSSHLLKDARLAVVRTVNPSALRLDQPLVVAVTRSLASLLTAWRRDVLEHALMFSAFVVLTGVGLALLQRRQRRHVRQWRAIEADKHKAVQRLALATKAAGVGVWEYGMLTRTLEWNEAMFAIHGHEPGSLQPSFVAWAASVVPADAGVVAAAMDRSISQGLPFDASFGIARPNGEIRVVKVQAAVHADESGCLVRMLGTCLDVTEALQDQAALQARNREIAQHNQVLELISRDSSLPQVLDVLVRQVQTLHPGMLCSILLLDAEGRHLLHGAAPSLSDAFNQAIDGVEIGEGVGSCGTAAFRGERVIVEDVRQHPYWAAFVALADAEGLRSCWSQPIQRADGRVLGTFAIYHKQVACPTADEIMLIERYARLAELAIERHRTQADLRVAAIAFESQESMIVTDANSVILRVNRAFTQATGYSAAEAIGRKPSLLQSGRHDVAFYRAMWASIHSTGSWSGETWDRRKNGEVYLDWLTITAVKGEDGQVSHYVGTHTDITQRKAAQEEIAHLAFFDTLTGLPNRRLLIDRLQQALASSTRSGRMGALLFIDLDNFKTLNDTMGHDQGDLLLEQVAQRLMACVREGDTVARLGGDEFVVMLEALSAAQGEAATQAEAVGNKILGALATPFQIAAHQHHGSASVGITLFADHQDTVDELLRRADLAMYQAKNAGRNAMRFFDPAMQAVVSVRAALEADLRLGLQRNQFLLHYQPQVSHEGTTVGAEALLRWCHPERGMVSPLDFIPLAEETGLILPLGHWVLQTACQQLVQWANLAATADLVLAVNVSARQFRQADFVADVLGLLAQTGARADRLKLELTESIVLDNVADVIGKMVALKAHGVRFSMDDFGTGYSSLSYLRRLPLDQLKIDRSFVSEVLTDPNDAAIAQTIIALGHSLGLNVIAEGVETAGQRDFLARCGCLHYQGYLYSRPIEAQGFADFLEQVRP